MPSANHFLRQLGRERLSSGQGNRPDNRAFLYSKVTQEKRRTIDWDIFWIREVLFASTPVLLVVLMLPKAGYIHTRGLAILLVILLGLTLFNVIWALFHRLPL